MLHPDSLLHIPRPSEAAYDLGLELSEREKIAGPVQSFFQNGVHAIAASESREDMGRVRELVENAGPRSAIERAHIQTELGDELAELRLVGESLVGLSCRRQGIADVLTEIQPGWLMSLGSSLFDTVIKIETSSQYTYLTVAETNTTRSIGGKRTHAYTHGYAIYTDTPQAPADRLTTARVAATTTLAEKTSTGTISRVLSATPDLPPRDESSVLPEPKIDEIIWAAAQLLSASEGGLTHG